MDRHGLDYVNTCGIQKAKLLRLLVPILINYLKIIQRNIE